MVKSLSANWLQRMKAKARIETERDRRPTRRSWGEVKALPVLGLLLCVGLVGVASAGSALPRATFDYFSRKPQSELRHCMLKLCWAGRSTQGQEPNVLLYTDPAIATYEFMLPFEESGTHGTLGTLGYDLRHRTTGKEFKSMLDSIAAHPCITAGFIKGRCLSMVLYDSTADSTTAYQSVVHEACAAPVLMAIRAALRGNAPAQAAVATFAELTDLVPERLYVTARGPSGSNAGPGDTVVDLAYFRVMPIEQMTRVEVKITYLDGNARGVKSVLIADTLNPGHPELFTRFRTNGMDYGLDSLGLEKRFSASHQELKTLIERLSVIGSPTSLYPAQISLTVLDRQGQRGCEILLAGDENGQAAFRALLSAFSENPSTNRWLGIFAVALGVDAPAAR
jgi:hypothetical protein